MEYKKFKTEYYQIFPNLLSVFRKLGIIIKMKKRLRKWISVQKNLRMKELKHDKRYFIDLRDQKLEGQMYLIKLENQVKKLGKIYQIKGIKIKFEYI